MKKIIFATMALVAFMATQANPLGPKEAIQKAHDEKVINDGQKEKLTLLFNEKAQEMRALKEKRVEKESEEMKALEEKYRKGIKEILDAETLRKFNAIKANKGDDKK